METTETIQKVNELVSVLTDDQKQLLKDTISMAEVEISDFLFCQSVRFDKLFSS